MDGQEIKLGAVAATFSGSFKVKSSAPDILFNTFERALLLISHMLGKQAAAFPTWDTGGGRRDTQPECRAEKRQV